MNLQDTLTQLLNSKDSWLFIALIALFIGGFVFKKLIKLIVSITLVVIILIMISSTDHNVFQFLEQVIPK